MPKSWNAKFFIPGSSWRGCLNGSSYSTIKNQFNNAMFDQVQTTSLRLEIQLQPGYSAGILEWRILNWGVDVKEQQGKL